MIKNAVVLLLTLFATAISFAGGAPKPIYVSWIPGTTMLMAGSKPSIRITLDVAPTVNTNIPISTTYPEFVTLPGSTVVATAGSRYVTFQVTLNGVDDPWVVSVSATSGGVTAQSPDMMIQRATLIRVTFNTSPVNELHFNATVQVKYTLSGPAGPSGYRVTFENLNTGDLDSDDFSEFFDSLQAGTGVEIPAGQSIGRISYHVPVLSAAAMGSISWRGSDNQAFNTDFFVSL